MRSKKQSEGIFIHVNARPVRDDKGHIKGAVVVFNDITESKKAQEKLRESEERFRSLIDASFEGIIIYEKDSIVDVNNSAAKNFGYSINEMIGMKMIDLVANESKKETQTKLARVAKNPDITLGAFDVICVRKDKSQFYVEVYGRGISFQNKRVRVIAFRDISTRKKNEQELQQHFDFENLITNISTKFINLEPHEIDEGIKDALKSIGKFSGVDRSYVALISDDGKTINANEEWCAQGIKSLRSQIKQTDTENMQHFLQQLKQKNPIYYPRIQDIPNEAASEKKWLKNAGIKSIVAVPMVLGRKLIGFIGFDTIEKEKEWTDDNIILLKIVGEIFARALELKQMFNALQQANEELELKEKQVQLINSEKMAALGQLVAGVAHEINTPLGALKSNNDVFIRSFAKIQRVVSDLEKDEHEHEYSVLNKLFSNVDRLNEVSKTAADRITNIVNSLRRFARLDQAEKDTVDLHEGLESTLTLVHHEFKNRITIHKEYGTLPPVNCFPNQINQVFMNILVNSSQAIEGKGEIFIRTYVSGKYVVIEMQDSGKGITENDMKKIFSPGFTTKGVGVGTGLGLSIVYQIIKDHNGEIDVGSKEGSGTVMKISLPI